MRYVLRTKARRVHFKQCVTPTSWYLDGRNQDEREESKKRLNQVESKAASVLEEFLKSMSLRLPDDEDFGLGRLFLDDTV